MGDFTNWAVTPMLPPPPPLPDRSKREGRYAGIPVPPAEQALYTTADKLATGLYNWGIRPLSSPLGIATAAMGPAIASGAVPMRYVVAGGGALGGHGAIQEGKAGQWMPSTESPGALLNATLAATPAAVAAWLPSTRASLIKPKTSTLSQPIPDVVPNPSRRQFLKQAGPVAAGAALGAPAAAKLAGKVASWSEKGVPAATTTTATAPKWVNIGTKVRVVPEGEYTVTKIFQNAEGDIAHKTVARYADRAEALRHAPEATVREAEIKLNHSPDPSISWGSATDGVSGGPSVRDQHLYLEDFTGDSPFVGREAAGAIHRRVDFEHPKYGKLVDIDVEDMLPGDYSPDTYELKAVFLDKEGKFQEVVIPDGTPLEHIRQVVGDTATKLMYDSKSGVLRHPEDLLDTRWESSSAWVPSPTFGKSVSRRPMANSPLYYDYHSGQALPVRRVFPQSKF